MPFQIFEANRGWDWQLTFRIQRELREISDRRWLRWEGQVSALKRLSTEVAAPWNTSITIPPVQITHFQHRAPLGLSNSNFEMCQTLSFVQIVNCIFFTRCSICAVHIVHFYVGFGHHLCKLDCNSMRRGRAPFEHLVLHKGQCCQWWHSEVSMTNKIVQSAKCISVQVCK